MSPDGDDKNTGFQQLRARPRRASGDGDKPVRQPLSDVRCNEMINHNKPRWHGSCGSWLAGSNACYSTGGNNEHACKTKLYGAGLAGALLSAQAGALSAADYDEVSPPQNITVFDPDGTITKYTFADPALVAVAERDGMATFYELTPSALAPDTQDWNVSSSGDPDEFTIYIPDGTGWAYIPSRFVSPAEAAVINAVLEEEESASPVYVASFVSPPDFRVTMEE